MQNSPKVQRGFSKPLQINKFFYFCLTWHKESGITTMGRC